MFFLKFTGPKKSVRIKPEREGSARTLKTQKMERPRVFDLSDSEGYLEHLNEHGYAVIGNVLDKETRTNLIEQFWDAWTTCSPGFDRNDKSTWTIEHCPMMFAKGMAVFSGLPHSDFMWNVRLQPNIKKIFSNVHGTEDLVSSFDGFSVFLNKKQKSPSWLHVDQNPSNTVYCVQGQYNFLPVNEDSAGFLVVPKSHTWETKTDKKGDWITFDDMAHRAVKLIVPENCFTLWNSRTIHANTGMTSNTVRFDRLTCYVTYLPRSMRPESVREQKIKAYQNSYGTSHWANRCEIKKYPWGFGPKYESRGFQKIYPSELTQERSDVF